ncbi:PH domain-containing protein [Planctomonas sp. JC2975]|uniref:PH domain-containing protein n=1 Tax=Planctomonas sp. JC2975 TaxID=2729626 RepID=UPI001473AF3C|nr:PH domain-containing protein [Planctomonas sp. JC2975]NNC11416.1 PH domain-containing protein [Planctomonas sp. JC2975]
MTSAPEPELPEHVKAVDTTGVAERSDHRATLELPERADRAEGSSDQLAAVAAAADSPDDDPTPWRRLDPRMLLVHPVRELIRYLPVLLLAVVAGSVGGEPWWTYVLSGIGVLAGLSRWFTTSYRITPTHVEVRRGLLNRRMLSVPRERIRSVDVDATLLHRLVRLAVVKVGTSASHGQDGLDFDGVSIAEVPALRAELLKGATALGGEAASNRPGGVDIEAAAGSRSDVGRSDSENFSGWRWSWARFAPFTLTGVGSLFVAAFFALQLQFFDGGLLLKLPVVRASIDTAARIPTLELVVGIIVALLVIASVVALVRYVLAYSGFTIWRSDAATLHVRHGLLRTRQVTLDERRLRGIQLGEALSLRMVGASSAHAIMTGIGRERGGLMVIEPAGPRSDALRVAEAVLGDLQPLTCDLTPHGPRAHRRRYTRAATGVAVIALAVLAAVLLGYLSAWAWTAFAVIVPVAALLAEDRWRSLGHVLLGDVLVARSGSLARTRVVLRTAGIIGFTVRRSYFQRRAGLATLIATTAAGRHRYRIPDVPIEEAWRITDAVLVGPRETARV